MEIITIELIFGLVILSIGAYFIGKKKNISLINSIGKRGFFISLILLVFETFILIKRGIDF